MENKPKKEICYEVCRNDLLNVFLLYVLIVVSIAKMLVNFIIIAIISTIIVNRLMLVKLLNITIYTVAFD